MLINRLERIIVKENLLKIKLFLLLKKKKGIKQYDLSGTAWKDMYTYSERAKMYLKAEKNHEKLLSVESEISDVITYLLDTSCSVDELLREFPETIAYIPESYKEKEKKK